jgi:accessory gene regulator protein AgrB
MKQIAGGITSYLIQEKIIDKEDQDIYLFGFNLFLKYLVSTVFAILLGVMNHSLKEVLITILLLLPLRSYAGGIHLKKDSLCLICSVAIIQLIVLINRLHPFNLVVSMFLSLVSCLLMDLIGPVDNKNKPLDNFEKGVFKNRLQKVLLVQLILFFTMILLNQKELVTLITLSFCVNLFSMLLGTYFRNRESKLFL